MRGKMFAKLIEFNFFGLLNAGIGFAMYEFVANKNLILILAGFGVFLVINTTVFIIEGVKNVK